MTIDIVEYTEEQLAALSTGRLQAIRSAQTKKNGLLQALAKKLQAAKERLMDRGTFASTIWAKVQKTMTDECNAEIENVRKSLLFYLRYVDIAQTEEGGKPDGVPYSVDYSLSEEERMTEVKNYYLTAYANPTERFQAYAKDVFAKSYLGETYSPLYHYLEDLI